MIDITVQGIPCEFNETALDDFDMLENLASMEQGNITALVSFAKGIFGEEQLENIKKSIRRDDGVCHLSDMNNFIGQAMAEAARVKKAEAKTSIPCPLPEKAPRAGTRRPSAIFRPELRPNGRGLLCVPRGGLSV